MSDLETERSRMAACRELKDECFRHKAEIERQAEEVARLRHQIYILDTEIAILDKQKHKLNQDLDVARALAMAYFDPLASDAMIMIERHPWLEDDNV